MVPTSHGDGPVQILYTVVLATTADIQLFGRIVLTFNF